MAGECFVICPIGEAKSDTRRHSDQLLKYIIEPVAKEFGFSEVSRADRLDEPGVITTQIIQRLVQAPLIIADLTDQNPNVFYELAIRHAVHLPLVHMMKAGGKLPFDIAGFRTIFFDLTDPDSIDETKVTLRQQIEKLRSKPFESPISVALNLQKLEESESPQDRMIADVLVGVSELKADIHRMSKRISNSDSGVFTQRYMDRIREMLPLSQLVSKEVRLKKAGREWRGLSPFTIEQSPSFYVNDQKGFYHCFSTGKHGDVFAWIMEVEGLKMQKAVIRAASLVVEMSDPATLDGDFFF